MLNAHQLKQLCEQLRLKPTKSRGQNFLLQEKSVNAMIEALELKNTDTVIEIGPGFGALTEALTRRAGTVITLELEQVFADYIQSHWPNVRIEHGDAVHTLSKVVETLPPGLPYKLAGNIPYNITGVLLEKAFTVQHKPECMAFMVQKEVGARIMAQPPRMNFLSVFAQYYSTPSVIARVPRGHFWPAPQVDSVMVLFSMHARQEPPAAQELFLKLVNTGFQHPRKTLKNNLTEVYERDKNTIEACIISAGLKPAARPAEVSVTQWEEICLCLK